MTDTNGNGQPNDFGRWINPNCRQGPPPSRDDFDPPLYRSAPSALAFFGVISVFMTIGAFAFAGPLGGLLSVFICGACGYALAMSRETGEM